MTTATISAGQPTFRAIRAQRLYEQIAEQIEDFIRANRLGPGDRLPPERELAEQFGVSRPSIREAMIALETAGLIEVRTGDGTFVRRVVPRGMPLLSWGHSDPGPGALEQFQARKIVEPELAALAAPRITAEEIAVLRAAVEEGAQRFAQGLAADEADYTFHVRLAESSGNLILAGVVRHLWELRNHEMWRVLRARVVQPAHRILVVEDRKQIIAACEKRDAAAACAAMHRLLERAEQRYFG
jgi:DNA-binding FadR family transcriptional regulator